MRGFMFPYRAKILRKQEINHNVMRFHIEKPYGYMFSPGQAIDLSIDQPGYELEVAPFTILNHVESAVLELVIKIRPGKKSLTNGLAGLDNGATLQITEPWDTYKYKGSGVFIAAGSGIIPFIPILKQIAATGVDLKEGHALIYANKKREDILFKSELKRFFGNNYTNVLSATKERSRVSGRVDFSFLKERLTDLNQHFYICGPKIFEQDVRRNLLKLGAKKRHIQTGYKF
ncbi:flavodoxin reductase [Flavobacteriaceae bacterium F89]|uniref:cytochrome-b5 reductase n=1 Tax=Cerina litoralis TaxID=2874477 RepID=A0AAE3EY76_9FLAO|nr:FAD-binding oxidoreductase [Cerina litoralis]MCG2462544.1 flavodoxin reductase [Cerina litoralis]